MWTPEKAYEKALADVAALADAHDAYVAKMQEAAQWSRRKPMERLRHLIKGKK